MGGWRKRLIQASEKVPRFCAFPARWQMTDRKARIAQENQSIGMDQKQPEDQGIRPLQTVRRHTIKECDELFVALVKGAQIPECFQWI